MYPSMQKTLTADLIMDRHNLLVIIITLTLLITCTGKEQSVQATSPNTGGWEIIGDKEGCKLYMRRVTQPNYPYAEGIVVYWSICKGSPSNSSVTVH